MAMPNSSKKSMSQHWDDYQPTKSTLAWACVGAAAALLALRAKSLLVAPNSAEVLRWELPFILW